MRVNCLFFLSPLFQSSAKPFPSIRPPAYTYIYSLFVPLGAFRRRHRRLGRFDFYDFGSSTKLYPFWPSAIGRYIGRESNQRAFPPVLAFGHSTGPVWKHTVWIVNTAGASLLTVRWRIDVEMVSGTIFHQQLGAQRSSKDGQ